MNSEGLTSRAERAGKTDWFVEHPPQQPKTEIADYVEAAEIPGLRVPARYSLQEALELSRTRPIYFRTEHPDEYTGASGVGDSYIFGPEDNISDVGDLLQKLNNCNRDSVYGYYSDNFGEEESEEKFQQLSYSAWEVIQGINKTIYKDDTIPDKFHIFSRWSVPTTTSEGTGSGRRANFMQIENGAVVHNSGDTVEDEFIAHNINLVSLYNEVNNLERFASAHSAIMEFQLAESETDNSYYFLQTHRGRDEQPADFELGETPPGYIEVTDVRGATTAEGVIVDLQYESLESSEYPITPRDSFFNHNYFQFNENPRQAKVVVSKSPLVKIASEHDYSHFRVDVLTKPQVVLFPKIKLPFVETFSDIMWDVLQNYNKEYIDVSFRAHVISDGRKAFISEPDLLVVRFWDRKNSNAIEVLVKTDGSYTEKPAGE